MKEDTKTEIILYVLVLIVVIVGLILGFIGRANIERILSDACNGDELTDWKKPNSFGYRIECNGIVQNKTCYIESAPYCAERNKWGDCINRERHKEGLIC